MGLFDFGAKAPKKNQKLRKARKEADNAALLDEWEKLCAAWGKANMSEGKRAALRVTILEKHAELKRKKISRKLPSGV